jgi:hypothetical protein
MVLGKKRGTAKTTRSWTTKEASLCPRARKMVVEPSRRYATPFSRSTPKRAISHIDRSATASLEKFTGCDAFHYYLAFMSDFFGSLTAKLHIGCPSCSAVNRRRCCGLRWRERKPRVYAPPRILL